jgi:ATP-dependent DNA helicase RecQ
VLQAIEFLGRDRQPIIAPTFFPPGFADAERKRKIPEQDRHLPGIALSIYNDGGWGKFVRQGKYEADSFSRELLAPSIQAISQLETPPDWLTWVPSMRTKAVEQFARELAAVLGIPSAPALIKTQTNAPQKSMQNATHQLDNVWNAFEVEPEQMLDGVCLLVDDIVDSGWTLAALAMKLKKAGAKDAIPFALATARPRGEG